MLILDKYILLNFPKTGSTFAREALKEIHKERKKKIIYQPYRIFNKNFRKSLFIKELMLPSTFNPSIKGQHGGFYQIPNEFKHKEIVSTIRNPLNRLLSIYNCKWWVGNNLLENSLREKYFPQFPNLNLIDFIKYRDLLEEQILPEVGKYGLGFQSIRFIKMYSRNPKITISRINSDREVKNAFFNDLKRIFFLKQENLTNDLIAYLRNKEYSSSELMTIKNKEKVNVSSNHSKLKEDEFKAAIKYIQEKEKILLEGYDTIGIKYPLSQNLL